MVISSLERDEDACSKTSFLALVQSVLTFLVSSFTASDWTEISLFSIWMRNNNNRYAFLGNFYDTFPRLVYMDETLEFKELLWWSVKSSNTFPHSFFYW